jgi:hypothetical protein
MFQNLDGPIGEIKRAWNLVNNVKKFFVSKSGGVVVEVTRRGVAGKAQKLQEPNRQRASRKSEFQQRQTTWISSIWNFRQFFRVNRPKE